MALPTPRLVPVVAPAEPVGAVERQASMAVGLRSAPAAPAAPAVAVVAAGRPRPRRPAWTLMLVPPPRLPAAVRTIPLRRRYLLAPLVAGALLVVGLAFAAAWMGARVDEMRLAPELIYLRGRLQTAETRVAALDDSLDALRTQVSSIAVAADAARAAAAASAARRRSPAASSGSSGGARRVAGVVLPLEGRITSLFSLSRAHPILRIRRAHKGLDIAAPPGTAIAAPKGGRVTRVARELGYGLIVQVDHGGGLTTRYAHLRSARVRVGDVVVAGETIATVGSSGLATAPHLHYEVRRHGEAVDPLRTPLGGP